MFWWWFSSSIFIHWFSLKTGLKIDIDFQPTSENHSTLVIIINEKRASLIIENCTSPIFSYCKQFLIPIQGVSLLLMCKSNNIKLKGQMDRASWIKSMKKWAWKFNLLHGIETNVVDIRINYKLLNWFFFKNQAGVNRPPWLHQLAVLSIGWASIFHLVPNS
jgi:hypothetical protein